MSVSDLCIIFGKASGSVQGEHVPETVLEELEVIRRESDEIAELRRLVEETTEPELKSYTTT